MTGIKVIVHGKQDVIACLMELVCRLSEYEMVKLAQTERSATLKVARGQ